MKKLLSKLGLKTGEVTDKGDESFSAYALERLKNPLVDLCLRARRLASLRSKYLSKFLRSIGSGDTLRYSLHQLKGDEFGTVSGRYSGTNMSQQIMKGSQQVEKFKSEEHIIREAIIPDEGFNICSADAAGIEFRLFVHYSKSERLLAYYRKDPHTDFHNIVTESLKGPSFMKLEWKPRRARGKILSFGSVYGLSNPETAAEQLECEVEEAIQAMDEYHQDFPEVGRVLRACSNLARNRGYVRTILGRRARFPHKNRLHSAFNRVDQGSAADLNKLKLRRTYRERKTLGIHKMRLTLHDEIVNDKDPDPIYTKRWQEMLDEQEVPLSVPILWEVAEGKNWKECE
jgi:DNA polymerase-1